MDSDRPARWEIGVWLALMACAIFLSLRDYQSFQFGTQRDDAEYVTLARSLLESNHYGLINQPGPPGVSQFPFGYPLLLAPLELFFPNNLDAMKALSLAATLCNGALLFWGWRRLTRRPYRWGLMVTGLYLLSPVTTGQTRMILPEPIFTTCYLGALILTARLVQSRRWLVGLVALSVILVFLIFTRTLGWVILASLLAYLVFFERKRLWRQMAVVAAGAVVLVGLVVAITPVGLSDLLPIKYADKFTGYLSGKGIDATERETPYPLLLASAAVTHVGTDIPSAIIPLGGGVREQEFVAQTGLGFLPELLRLGVVGLLVIGLLRWLYAERASIFLLSALVYLGALFFWLWTGPRLLYPILPQLYLAFLLGIEGVAGRMARGVRVPAAPAKSAAVVTMALGIAAILIYKSMSIDDSRAHTGDLSARTAWVKENTPVSAIVMSREPMLDYVYGERRTVGFPSSSLSSGELANYLESAEIDYVLIAPRLQWQPSFAPVYDSRTDQLLNKLRQLASDNQVQLIYATGPDLIQVYKTRR